MEIQVGEILGDRRKLRKSIFNKVLCYILFLNNRRESNTLIILINVQIIPSFII